MAKNKISVLVLCVVYGLLYGSGNLLAQKPAPLENIPVLQSTTELRKKLIDLEKSFLYVREKTGKNDGKEVKMFLASVGLPEGNPWCAASQSYCHQKLNIPCPISGYSPDWFRAAVVYEKGRDRQTPFKFRGGEVTGYWVPAKGRIGHVGMAERQDGFDVYTIEFNYMNRVMKVARSYWDITIVADHVGFQELKAALKKKKK